MERKRLRKGHSLAEDREGTRHDTERKKLSEGHSLPADRRGKNLSGHGKKVTEQVALTNWRWQRERLCQDTKRKRPSEGALTSWIPQRGRTFQDTKRADWVRGTHFLETTEGGLVGHRNKATSKGRSPSGDHTRGDL